MSRHYIPLLGVAVMLFTIAMTSQSQATALTNATTPTAYEMVENYGFPRGILPEGVTGYTLDPNGSFEVYRPEDCHLDAGNLQVVISKRISGNIQNRTIQGLDGVKVKLVLKWFGVDQVERIDDRIQAHTRFVSRSLPVSKFATSLHCEWASFMTQLDDVKHNNNNMNKIEKTTKKLYVHARNLNPERKK